MLHHFHQQGIARAGRIIHDAFLWGGAAVLNPNETPLETQAKAKLCGVVNGRLSNCYSVKDYVLKYMFMPFMSKVEPIGLVPIFEDIAEVRRSGRELSPEEV